jgi:hypothetical protein
VRIRPLPVVASDVMLYRTSAYIIDCAVSDVKAERLAVPACQATMRRASSALSPCAVTTVRRMAGWVSFSRR